MAASQKTPRAAPRKIATQKSLRSASCLEGDVDVEALVAVTMSVPMAALRGGGRTGLPPCRGATLKGPETAEDETSSKELGRYATPSCGVSKTKSTGGQTPRRVSTGSIPAGLMVPSPPSSPHSGRPKGPVRRAASSQLSAEEVKNLSTQKLGLILRRGSDLRNQHGDSDDEDARLLMRAVKTDLPRTDTGLEEASAPAAEQQVARRPSQQEQLVSQLFLSDDERLRPSSKVSAAQTEGDSTEGLSAKQQRKRDGRRRSFELQAMLNSVENQEETGLTDAPRTRDSALRIAEDMQSKEDEYWSNMWQITKTMMREKDSAQDEVPKLDVAEPGLDALVGL